jgi:hypothetical protein
LAGLVELAPEGLVDGLEGEDSGDTGQVEAVVEELGYLSEAGEVVVAVAAGAALAAGRTDQAARFVEAKVLGSAADQFSGDGDPVHTLRGVGRPAASRRHWKIFLPAVAWIMVSRV